MPQTRLQSRRFIVAVLGLVAGLAGLAGVVSVAQQPEDKFWPGYGNGPDNSRYFASRQINKSNVANLDVAWTYPFGETGGNPIVARGVIYGRGRNGSIVAVDAKTGRELWVRENMQGMTNRGMNYWSNADGSDERLLFAMNDYLQALDAKTGKSILSFGKDGVVDMREGIMGRDPGTITRIQSGTPGEVFENLILLGGAMGEAYMSPPGDLRAYNVITGELVWTFHTVPRPGEYGYDTWPKEAWRYIGGTNTWGELTVDTERGIAYFPTGSPTYDFYGADRPGANLFGVCLIALDARTGQRLWHFQNVHHDIQDLDNNAAPQLTTIRHNGRTIDVVAMAGKTGFLYVFDRVTGEPIWPIEEKPVPQHALAGEELWPTQPFPTNPPPFARIGPMTVEDINPYLPEEQREAFKQRLLAAVNPGIFAALTFQETVQIPGSNGGALFGTTAAEPGTGVVYVISQDNPGFLRLLRPGEQAGRGGGGGANAAGLAVYTQNCQVCHGPNRLGTENGVPLAAAVGTPPTPGAPLFTADQIRTVVSEGKGRMPPFPHLTTADINNVVAFLTAPPGGGGGGRGRGAGPAGSGAPPELIAGSGSAVARPPAAGGRGELPPYPEGVPQTERYVINTYGTIGNNWKPPFTTIVKYDLNEPSIKWRVGFGDDPTLAAQGITGTGMPQMRNSIIVTEAGLVFGAGRDNKVRAWDAADGRLLWTSNFAGNFVGSPAMYEIDGRQYLLLPAAAPGPGGGRGGQPPAAPAGGPAGTPGTQNLPTGWIAYALPR